MRLIKTLILKMRPLSTSQGHPKTSSQTPQSRKMLFHVFSVQPSGQLLGKKQHRMSLKWLWLFFYQLPLPKPLPEPLPKPLVVVAAAKAVAAEAAMAVIIINRTL